MSIRFSKISIASTRSPGEPVEDIYPKQLPELKVGPIYDESGFSLNERLALRQAWRLIKPFERRYGKQIYFTFLMENYKSFEYFRDMKKLDLHSLHNHSLAFMRFIHSVIEQNDPVVFHTMLSDNHALHSRCHVNADYIKMFLNSMISYILDKLKDVSSTSLVSGFQKLFNKFNSFYEDDRNKRLSFAFRRSEDVESEKSAKS